MDRRTFASGVAALTLMPPPGRRVWAAPTEFGSWPQGSSPTDIGARLAERLLAAPLPMPLMFDGALRIPERVAYWEACTWYGALTYAQLARNESLRKKLVARFAPLLGPKATLIPFRDADEPVFGIVPLELYIQTRDARYLTIGKKLADSQAGPPSAEFLQSLKPNIRRAVEQAVKENRSWHTRALIDASYWIDDAYLVTMLQVQAFRATGARSYLDRATRDLIVSIEQLQKPNGLFYHGPEAPFFWGRGNGWAAAGLTELLRTLPEKHPDQPRIMDSYRKMMSTLLQHQDKSGVWRQLVDHPDFWPETSCTAMFTFSFVTGVKNGWLDANVYAPAARKGWLSLMRFIAANGDVGQVCEGTNKSQEARYYAERKRNTADPHGQASILWAASALLR